MSKTAKKGNLQKLGKVDSIQSKTESYNFEKTNNNITNLNLEIGYSNTIQHVKEEIPQNGILLVTGENGSGKTAFLLTLASSIYF